MLRLIFSAEDPTKQWVGGSQELQKCLSKSSLGHDKEDHSASLNIFFTAEVTAVWTCGSGEGKGSHCRQNCLSEQSHSCQMPAPPSICRHRTFQSDILNCSPVGCRTFA